MYFATWTLNQTRSIESEVGQERGAQAIGLRPVELRLVGGKQKYGEDAVALPADAVDDRLGEFKRLVPQEEKRAGWAIIGRIEPLRHQLLARQVATIDHVNPPLAVDDD